MRVIVICFLLKLYVQSQTQTRYPLSLAGVMIVDDVHDECMPSIKTSRVEIIGKLGHWSSSLNKMKASVRNNQPVLQILFKSSKNPQLRYVNQTRNRPTELKRQSTRSIQSMRAQSPRPLTNPFLVHPSVVHNQETPPEMLTPSSVSTTPPPPPCPEHRHQTRFPAWVKIP